MIWHRRYLILIAAALAALQIGVLASMIMGRAAILRDGREVVLEVQPVDPRDLLRGDYVTIGYNISNLPASILEQGGTDPSGGPYPVVVRLRAGDGGIWQAVAARYGEAPLASPSGDDVDMRGTTYAQPGAVTDVFQVDYGIERFYVPEGQGRPIEDGVGERSFTMKVAVSEDGAAQIKSLHDGDAMIFFEPLY